MTLSDFFFLFFLLSWIKISNFTGLSTQIFLSRIVNLGKFQTALSVSIQREISSQLDIWMYLHAQTCITSGLEVIT